MNEDTTEGEQAYVAGFACLVGRPNAGKSTLTNALVGTKVAITSSKPQTTRHTIRGIVSGEHSQLILVDTPGLHKPRTLLGQRLNDLVRETLLEVDVIGFCLPANQRIGPGDQFIARELAELRRGKRTPVVALATKSDTVDKKRLAEHLIAIDQLGDWSDIVPCSATRGDQVSVVGEVLASHLPPSPGPLYPDDQLTDELVDGGAEAIGEGGEDVAGRERGAALVVGDHAPGDAGGVLEVGLGEASRST